MWWLPLIGEFQRANDLQNASHRPEGHGPTNIIGRDGRDRQGGEPSTHDDIATIEFGSRVAVAVPRNFDRYFTRRLVNLRTQGRDDNLPVVGDFVRWGQYDSRSSFGIVALRVEQFDSHDPALLQVGAHSRLLLCRVRRIGLAVPGLRRWILRGQLLEPIVRKRNAFEQNRFEVFECLPSRE